MVARLTDAEVDVRIREAIALWDATIAEWETGNTELRRLCATWNTRSTGDTLGVADTNTIRTYTTTVT